LHADGDRWGLLIVRAMRRRRQVELAIVSFFNPSDFPGGAERIAWAEAELLATKRVVAFVAASPPREEAPFAQYRLGGWTRPMYQAPWTRRNPLTLVAFHLLSQFNPVVLLEAVALFRRLRPAIVHTHNLIGLSPTVWLAARLSGAKVVHTHHDHWLVCERVTMTDARGLPCNESRPACSICRALRPAKKLQAGLLDAELFPSAYLRDRMARKGEIVPSFSTAEIVPRDDAPEALTLLYLGALTPPKLGVLLEGFEAAFASGAAPLRLVIAGAGPLESSVTRLARSNGNVSYRGQVDAEERDRLLGEASAVVIPSVCPEVSPLVFFEALAAGVPVIASDIGGISELEQYGNVVLVPPGDADALANALTDLLADEGRLARLRAAAQRSRHVASRERFEADVERALDAAT
jgi:glycosyltransferase involved in cell wall biosynthesis